MNPSDALREAVATALVTIGIYPRTGRQVGYSRDDFMRAADAALAALAAPVSVADVIEEERAKEAIRVVREVERGAEPHKMSPVVRERFEEHLRNRVLAALRSQVVGGK